MKKLLIILVVISTISACGDNQPSRGVNQKHPYIPSKIITTSHFIIRSTASSEQTRDVSDAVENLYRVYAATFHLENPNKKFQLVLYRDQAEFKANNLGPSWAEAYYKMPYSYAYPGERGNPYHWMLHEATHQLLTEGSGYRLRRWINEGTAAYFGASRLTQNNLELGTPDPAAYPIWWLKEIEEKPNKEIYFDGEALFPLRAVIEDSDLPISTGVNHHYIAYWSLVHFLIEGENGKYHQHFLQLVKRGGDPAAFKELIGSYDEIEPQWKRHLITLKSRASAP